MLIITGPPTHRVGGSTVLLPGVCRRLLTLHGGPAGGFTRADQAMTSCRLQFNYSPMETRQGGPVVSRPVRATPCFHSLSLNTFKQQLKTHFFGQRGTMLM